MSKKLPFMSLADRLYFWECELELEPSAHPDPARRLDHIIEEMIDSETIIILRLSDAKRMIAKMGEANASLRSALDSTEKRNKVLEARWTQLRELLGISNKHEEPWS